MAALPHDHNTGRDREERLITTDSISPAGPYAQGLQRPAGVDLSWPPNAALRDTPEERLLSSASTWTRRERQNRARRQFQKMLEAEKPEAPFKGSLYGNSAVHPQARARRRPSSFEAQAQGHRVVSSPSRPRTTPPAGLLRPSRKRGKFTRRIWRKRSQGLAKGSVTRLLDVGLSPYGYKRSTCRTGRRSAPGWSLTRPPTQWSGASSHGPPGRASSTSPANPQLRGHPPQSTARSGSKTTPTPCWTTNLHGAVVWGTTPRTASRPSG